MLSQPFQTILRQAPPGKRIAGIVTWEITFPKNADPVHILAAAKHPLIAAAQKCHSTRVNSLEGTPQAILEAPIEGWRQLLRSQQTLLNSTNIRVDANTPAFSTFPDPGD